jgi:hypothetical protein
MKGKLKLYELHHTGRIKMRRAVSLTLMAAFAAIYAVLSLIPAFGILGGTGFISVAAFISPVVGLILGPVLGAASMTIGGVLATMLNFAAAPLGFFSFIPGAVCAFSSGLVERGRAWVAASILGILIVIFLIYPANNVQPIFPYYVWIHLVALFILVSPIRKQATELAKKPKVNEAVTGMVLTIFPSTMTEQLTGSIIFALILGPAVSSVWSQFGIPIMLAFPIERTIITVGSSIIGAALFRSLRAAGLDITK